MPTLFSMAHVGAIGPRRAETGPGKGRCRNCLKGGYPGRTWWNHREWPSLARFKWMQEAGVDGNIIRLEENEVTMWRQILAICAFIAGLQAVTRSSRGSNTPFQRRGLFSGQEGLRTPEKFSAIQKGEVSTD